MRPILYGLQRVMFYPVSRCTPLPLQKLSARLNDMCVPGALRAIGTYGPILFACPLFLVVHLTCNVLALCALSTGKFFSFTPISF